MLLKEMPGLSKCEGRLPKDDNATSTYVIFNPGQLQTVMMSSKGADLHFVLDASPKVAKDYSVIYVGILENYATLVKRVTVKGVYANWFDLIVFLFTLPLERLTLNITLQDLQEFKGFVALAQGSRNQSHFFSLQLAYDTAFYFDEDMTPLDSLAENDTKLSYLKVCGVSGLRWAREASYLHFRYLSSVASISLKNLKSECAYVAVNLLKGSLRLQQLEVADCGRSVELSRGVIGVLEKTKSLKYLALKNFFDHSSLVEFTRLVGRNQTRLISIEIEDSLDYSNTSAWLIGAMIKRNIFLRGISLKGSLFTSRGASFIVKSMEKHNRTLQVLRMIGCGIEDPDRETSYTWLGSNSCVSKNAKGIRKVCNSCRWPFGISPKQCTTSTRSDFHLELDFKPCYSPSYFR